jgi:hypothetical protein
LIRSWGYAHLYDARTSEKIDDFAITEALDERYATRFGDLSIHEFATDPQTNLAYSSYYSGGLRVLRISRERGLEETGRFIDEGGSNFWGVEHYTDAAGNRLIVGSDRDYGLNIVKYTGPGAVLAKPPAPAPAPAPAPVATTAAKAVPSSFFGYGALQRMTVRNRRAVVTITVPGPGRATGILKARIGRTMFTLGRATATARRAGRLRLTFSLSARADRALPGVVARRKTRRTSGVLRVSFTRTGGVERTRNRSVSITRR